MGGARTPRMHCCWPHSRVGRGLLNPRVDPEMQPGVGKTQTPGEGVAVRHAVSSRTTGVRDAERCESEVAPLRAGATILHYEKQKASTAMVATLENAIIIGGNALPGRTAAARRRSCTSSSAPVPVLPALSLQKETSEDNSAPSVDRPPDWDGQSGEFWRAGRETSIRRGPRAAKRGQGGAAARCGLDGVRQFSRVVLLTPPWFDLLRANPRRQLDDTNLRARTSVASLPHPASFSLPPSQRSSSPFLFPLRTDFSLRRSAFTMLASLSLVALASLAAARPVFQMDAMLATVTQAVSLPNTTQTDNATWYLRELFFDLVRIARGLGADQDLLGAQKTARLERAVSTRRTRTRSSDSPSPSTTTPAPSRPTAAPTSSS